MRTHSVHLLVLCTLVAVSSALTAKAGAAQAALSLPNGFHESVYAQGLTNPTALALGPDRRLYVAQQDGTVLVVTSGGTAVVATGFGAILGLAWHGHKLYVSSTGTISTLTPNAAFSAFSRRTIVAGLPTGKHQNDGLAFAGSWMYVGVGSTCNACVESDRRSATIMRFHLDGTHGQVFASGLRNPYGLAIRPSNGKLYATDNGRDDFRNGVPDELNLIVRSGRYGWPDCWGRNGGSHCKGTLAPVALFEPHSSADGLLFYTGSTFPARLHGDAFVAEWGDDVTSLGTGHIVKDVHFSGNRATVTTFATGFSHPLAVAVPPDGSLLIADWGTGIIWRIQANGR